MKLSKFFIAYSCIYFFISSKIYNSSDEHKPKYFNSYVQPLNLGIEYSIHLHINGSKLIAAVQSGNIETVKNVLKYSDILDINYQNQDTGSTALHYAMRCRKYDIADLLEKIPNIDREIKNNKGLTPDEELIECIDCETQNFFLMIKNSHNNLRRNTK